MTASYQGNRHLFGRLGDGREVFFVPQIPFIRGYVVRSRALRRLLVRRLAVVDLIIAVLLATALVIGWTAGRMGVCLSLWLAACELTYWAGTRRLLRKLTPLPLRLSLRIYTRNMDAETLCCGIFVSALLGLLALAFGAASGDVALLAFGCVLLIWSCRLASVPCRRWRANRLDAQCCKKPTGCRDERPEPSLTQLRRLDETCPKRRPCRS